MDRRYYSHARCGGWAPASFTMKKFHITFDFDLYSFLKNCNKKMMLRVSKSSKSGHEHIMLIPTTLCTVAI